MCPACVCVCVWPPRAPADLPDLNSLIKVCCPADKAAAWWWHTPPPPGLRKTIFSCPFAVVVLCAREDVTPFQGLLSTKLKCVLHSLIYDTVMSLETGVTLGRFSHEFCPVQVEKYRTNKPYWNCSNSLDIIINDGQFNFPSQTATHHQVRLQGP